MRRRSWRKEGRGRVRVGKEGEEKRMRGKGNVRSGGRKWWRAQGEGGAMEEVKEKDEYTACLN